MNPRILKKVCKRIVELGHPIAKGAWIDNEDSVGMHIGSYLYKDKRQTATAKQFRSHYMAETQISSIYVLGGGLDYWGEANDPYTVYDAARQHVLWKYGTPTKSPLKDKEGNIIDWLDDWPKWNGRLTAMHVIKHLKVELRSDTQ